MNRRHFVKLFGGLTLAGLPGLRLRAHANHIGVVGGGIIGASIAYHLTRRGARVTLFERERPASGATGNSFAWLNANYSKRPWSYYHLNRLGIEGYRHLDAELDGALGVQWGGSLQWHDDIERAQRLRQNIRHHLAWGYATRLIEAEEFERLEPNLVPGPVLAAAHCAQEATIDPVHAVEALIEKATGLGTTVQYPCEVTGLDVQWGRLRGVRTTKEDVELDALVIAAGVDTPRVAALAGLEVPLKDSPGILAHTTPQPASLSRIALSPGGHVKQHADGRMIAGATFSGTPNLEPSPEQAERIRASVSRYFPALANAEIEHVTQGWRPLPRDNHPIIGFAGGSPDVYLAVMHSGMTLAPIVGRLAAVEILDGISVDALEPFRLSRFEGTAGPAGH